jgi:hypothetical protein
MVSASILVVIDAVGCTGFVCFRNWRFCTDLGQKKTFIGTNQLSGSLVVLVLALVIGQVRGVLYFSVGVGLLVGLIMWIVAATLITLGIRLFTRAKLLLILQGRDVWYLQPFIENNEMLYPRRHPSETLNDNFSVNSN